MKKVENGQGFICKDESEKLKIFIKLEKLGYPIFEGSFKGGKLGKDTHENFLGIGFEYGKEFTGCGIERIEHPLNQEEFFSEVLIASQGWTPYPKPKKLLLGDNIGGEFDEYDVEVLGEYAGRFIDINGELWNFAKEIPIPRYTHEQLVEILGQEFIQI